MNITLKNKPLEKQRELAFNMPFNFFYRLDSKFGKTKEFTHEKSFRAVGIKNDNLVTTIILATGENVQLQQIEVLLYDNWLKNGKITENVFISDQERRKMELIHISTYKSEEDFSFKKRSCGLYYKDTYLGVKLSASVKETIANVSDEGSPKEFEILRWILWEFEKFRKEMWI